METIITLGHRVSEDGRARQIVRLESMFSGSFLRLAFTSDPETFHLIATSSCEQIGAWAREVGQTPEEYLRDAVGRAVIHDLALPPVVHCIQESRP